jgi:hypothetical protein
MEKLIRGAVTRKTVVRIFLALLVIAGLLAPVSAPKAATQSRVVAVGDIHGDYSAFVRILRQTGLLDSGQRWTGGAATLVQTGDFLDRGPKEREVMELLMQLEQQAPRSGGRVVTLLGNHEVMNLMGDLRYVAPEGFAAFADRNSEKRRQAAYREWVSWQKARARALRKPAPKISAETEAQWMQAHPAGYVEHREAFAPDGPYGKWLRQKDAIAVLDGTVFVHGGFHPQLASWKLDNLNARIRNELQAFDDFKTYLVRRGVALPFFTLDEMFAAAKEDLAFHKPELENLSGASGEQTEAFAARVETLRRHVKSLEDFLKINSWMVMHEVGPLWFRGFADWDETKGTELTDKMLKAFGATRFVVGHTPTPDGRIQARFGGRVFLIDTGMLSSYYEGGRASALEIESGRFTGVYEDQRALLLETTPPRSQSVGQDQDREAYGGGVEGTQEPAQNSSEAPKRVWYGADKQPLPFQTDEEVIEFLKTAKPGKARGASKGTMGVRWVELEKGGIKARAALRDMREEKDVATLASGQRILNFRDDWIFECAAYELARMLGLDNIPPTTERTIFGKKSSLQLWLENVLMDEEHRLKNKITPPDVFRWNRQVQTMRAFDNLIYNFDRNMGNILIDTDWKLWMIDHTRAFRREADLPNAASVHQIERNFFERIKALDEKEVEQRLKPYLRKFEIEALMKRRDKLVEHIEKLIAEKGEAQVLFTW